MDLDPVLKRKHMVRVLTNQAIALGLLSRQPCEVCGMTKVHAHHVDYTKPLEVRWLCSAHHRENHRGETR